MRAAEKRDDHLKVEGDRERAHRALGDRELADDSIEVLLADS